MTDKEHRDWSEDEASILHHEAFIAEVIRRRTVPTVEEGKESWWKDVLRFLQTPAGIAIITILGTGIIGALITGYIQYQAREREFQQELIKGTNERALVAFKEHIEQEREATTQIFGLIGKCITVSEDLIDLTGPHFDPTQFKVGIEEQRTQMRKEYNDCDDQWRWNREKFGLQIRYYHPSHPEVSKFWEETQIAVTKYMDCASEWYLSHNRQVTDITNACGVEREELKQQTQQLNTVISDARIYLWKELKLLPNK